MLLPVRFMVVFPLIQETGSLLRLLRVRAAMSEIQLILIQLPLPVTRHLHHLLSLSLVICWFPTYPVCSGMVRQVLSRVLQRRATTRQLPATTMQERSTMVVLRCHPISCRYHC